MKRAFELAVRKTGLSRPAFREALAAAGLKVSEDQVYGWANLAQEAPVVPAYALQKAAQLARVTVDELVAEATGQPSPVRQAIDAAIGELREELRAEIAGLLSESRREMPPEVMDSGV